MGWLPPAAFQNDLLQLLCSSLPSDTEVVALNCEGKRLLSAVMVQTWALLLKTELSTVTNWMTVANTAFAVLQLAALLKGYFPLNAIWIKLLNECPRSVAPVVLFRNSRQLKEAPITWLLLAFSMLASPAASPQTECAWTLHAAAFTACWRSAVMMSLLLLLLLLWDCFSFLVPEPALHAWESCVNTAVANSCSVSDGGEQACLGHRSVLIYSWSQIALTSLAGKFWGHDCSHRAERLQERCTALEMDCSVNLCQESYLCSLKALEVVSDLPSCPSRTITWSWRFIANCACLSFKQKFLK